jgi:tetratricopeptide (TPR) repeat protein
MTHALERRPVASTALALALAVGSALVVTALAPAPAPALGQTMGQATPTTRSRFSRDADAEIRFQEGLLQYSRRQLKEAQANFESLVDEDPADAEAYYYLGLTQLDQQRPAEAVRRRSFTRG